MTDPLTAHEQFVLDVRSVGSQGEVIAQQAAYDWTGWGNKLDSLLRSMPEVPSVYYLTETGERTQVGWIADVDVRTTICELLADALSRADTTAAELRRHRTIVGRRTAEIVALLTRPATGNAGSDG